MPVTALADLSHAELSPELRRAADWVVANTRDVALFSMRECARRAELAPATFTRLAQALGFDGFDTIKRHCQDLLGAQSGYAARAEALQDNTLGKKTDWLVALNGSQQANITSVAVLNTRVQFERAADAILAAKHVYFLGLRASHGLAFHLHYTYGLLAANGVLLQGLGGTLIDQLGQMDRGDLLVAVSLAPYTRQTVEAVTLVRQQKVPVLAISDSARSPIAEAAAHTLLFGADSPSYFQSMVGALALAEALAAAVAVRGGRSVLNRLRSVQQRLDAQKAYWQTAAEPTSHPKKSGRTTARKTP